MSNVQEALKTAIELLDKVQTKNLNTPWDILIRTTISQCKAALSEIGKCEPVAWMNDKTTSGIFARHKEGAVNFGCDIPLYKNPHPREWVGLNDAQIERATCGLATDYYKARAIERELKQLNTKG